MYAESMSWWCVVVVIVCNEAGGIYTVTWPIVDSRVEIGCDDPKNWICAVWFGFLGCCCIRFALTSCYCHWGAFVKGSCPTNWMVVECMLYVCACFVFVWLLRFWKHLGTVLSHWGCSGTISLCAILAFLSREYSWTWKVFAFSGMVNIDRQKFEISMCGVPSLRLDGLS